MTLPAQRLHGWTRRIARESILAAAGGQAFIGVAGIVLGILALVSYLSPVGLTLTLVAMLCVGAGVLLSGTSISGKVLTLLRR